MGILGLFVIAVSVILSAAVESAVRGKTGINRWIGIRSGYMTYSPAAWIAGHRAARWPIHLGTALYAAAGVLMLAVPAWDKAAGSIGFGASLVLLGLIGFGTFRANRAAAAVVAGAASASRDS